VKGDENSNSGLILTAKNSHDLIEIADEYHNFGVRLMGTTSKPQANVCPVFWSGICRGLG
jgi:hypothetical protein